MSRTKFTHSDYSRGASRPSFQPSQAFKSPVPLVPRSEYRPLTFFQSTTLQRKAHQAEKRYRLAAAERAAAELDAKLAADKAMVLKRR